MACVSGQGRQPQQQVSRHSAAAPHSRTNKARSAAAACRTRTLNAGGSHGGKSERRMLRVLACVLRGASSFSLRVMSMMAAYLHTGRHQHLHIRMQVGVYAFRRCLGGAPVRRAASRRAAVGAACGEQACGGRRGLRRRAPLLWRVGPHGCRHAPPEKGIDKLVQGLSIDGRVVGGLVGRPGRAQHRSEARARLGAASSPTARSSKAFADIHMRSRRALRKAAAAGSTSLHGNLQFYKNLYV